MVDFYEEITKKGHEVQSFVQAMRLARNAEIGIGQTDDDRGSELEIELRFLGGRDRLADVDRETLNRLAQAFPPDRDAIELPPWKRAGFTPDQSTTEYRKVIDYWPYTKEELRLVEEARRDPRRREPRAKPKSSYRKTVDLITEGIKYDLKNELRRFESPKFGFVIVVSQEKPVSPEEYDWTESGETVRDKSRQSLTLDKYRLDLTEVVEDANTYFSVEIEFDVPERTGFPDLFATMEQIFKVFANSEIIDSVPLRRFVMRDFRAKLGDFNPYIHSLDRKIPVQPLDLTYRQLTWGRLIGGEIKYTATPKADGIRYFLFITDSGLWLIHETSMDHVFGWDDSLIAINDTILDGELLPHSKLIQDDFPSVLGGGVSSDRYIYMAFDCMRSSEDKLQIQEMFHPERRDVCLAVSSRLKHTGVGVYIKDYRELTDAESFFNSEIPDILDSPNVFYQTDGMVFTPINAPYKSRVYRWKPPHRMSIDFSLDFRATPGGQREVVLRVQERWKPNKKRGLVPFTGSQGIPYFQSKVVGIPSSARVGDIFEFKWIPGDEEGDGYFEVLQRRFDRKVPNDEVRAESIWRLVHDPITEEVLRGNTFRLLTKYHNRIKRELIGKLPEIVGRDNLVLLDLGSGKGGDVSKWAEVKEIRKVVAVEKDDKKIPALKQRSGIDPKIVPLHAEAEDAEIIRLTLGEPADVITLLFSMTHFWDNQHHVDRLARTIQMNLKPDGLIVFATMDGDLVRQAFAPALGGIQRYSDEKPAIALAAIDDGYFEPAQVKYLVGRTPKIWVDILGTDVRNQLEYLAHPSDLLWRLGPRYRLKEWRIANGENFLSSSESRFTRLYSYGWIKPQATTRLTPSPSPIGHTTRVRPPTPRYKTENIPRECIFDLGHLGLINDGPLPKYGDPDRLALNGAAEGDDVPHQITEYYGEISTIRGRFNWAHATLRAVSPEYALEPRYISRALMAQALRVKTESEQVDVVARYLGYNLLILARSGKFWLDFKRVGTYEFFPQGRWIVLLLSYGHYNPMIDFRFKQVIANPSHELIMKLK